MFQTLKEWAHTLKHNLYALYLAYHDKDIPFIAKMVALIVVGYALSPIDLIPDFIPIIGYLDDLILLPLGIWVAIKLIPENIWLASKERAKDMTFKSLPHSKIAGIVVVIVWVTIIVYLLTI